MIRELLDPVAGSGPVGLKEESVDGVEELLPHPRRKPCELVPGLLVGNVVRRHRLLSLAPKPIVYSIELSRRKPPTRLPAGFELRQPLRRIELLQEFKQELVPRLAAGLSSLQLSEHVGVKGDAGHAARTHGRSHGSSGIYDWTTAGPSGLGPPRSFKSKCRRATPPTHPAAEASWSELEPNPVQLRALGMAM